MSDKLKITGVLSQGYGIIPKMLMKDKELSIEAKGIYAYIASYAGNGSTAFPSVNLICSDLNISENRFHKHKVVLIEKGYIQVEQERTGKGMFKRNIYTINSVLMPREVPDVVEPTRQNEVTDNSSPTRQYPGMDNPSMDNPGMENDVYINNSLNNNSSNNNSINNNNNNKEKEKEVVVVVPEKNVFQIYQENFGMMNPLVTEEIMHWENDLGPELVMEAMKRAALNQKPFSWSIGIMKNWALKNIKSVAEAEAADVAYSNQSRRSSNFRGGTPKAEKLPEWAKETQPIEDEMMSDDKQRAFEERLKRFRTGESVAE